MSTGLVEVPAPQYVAENFPYQLPSAYSIQAPPADETKLSPEIAYERESMPAPPATNQAVDTSPVVSSPAPQTRDEARPGKLVEVQQLIQEKVDGLFKLEDSRDISAQAVFLLTNQERTQRGMAPFVSQSNLTRMAELKIDDMVKNEYFEHVSPQGLGVEYFAEQASYQYLLIGENLAYGSFRDAEHVVEAWMDSPGHRSNILHDSYREIGIASRFVQFKGEWVWFVVQEFGVPGSVCQPLDDNLRAQIEEKTNELEQQNAELETESARINSRNPSSSGYAEAVETFNQLVNDYNQGIREQRSLVQAFNQQVNEYNDCLAQFSS